MTDLNDVLAKALVEKAIEQIDFDPIIKSVVGGLEVKQVSKALNAEIENYLTMAFEDSGVLYEAVDKVICSKKYKQYLDKKLNNILIPDE